MKKFKYMVVTFASLTLWGCATVPAKNYQFENSRTYSNKTYDQVWDGLIAFLTSNNIPIKTIEKDSGVIYSEIENFSKPSFAKYFPIVDCGTPPFLWYGGRAFGSFNIFVSKTSPQPKVTITTSISQEIRYENQVSQISCNSMGNFEKGVLDSI